MTTPNPAAPPAWREAAERLMAGGNLASGYLADWNPGAISFRQIADLIEVSQSFLAELDPTPVDEAWMRSLGWGLADGAFILTFSPPRVLPLQVRFYVGPKTWLVAYGQLTVINSPTRGQLRTLCRALSITLNTGGGA